MAVLSLCHWAYSWKYLALFLKLFHIAIKHRPEGTAMFIYISRQLICLKGKRLMPA
jgi:hypothetical protein